MSTRKKIEKTKDREWFEAMLVGGPSDLYKEIRQRLGDKYNILLTQHGGGYRGSRVGGIPSNVDFVIILQDMISHSAAHKVQEECKKRGIPCVRTQRKKAGLLDAALRNRGFSARSGAVWDALRRADERRRQAEREENDRTLKLAEPAEETDLPAEPTPLPSGIWTAIGILMEQMKKNGVHSIMVEATDDGFEVTTMKKE